MIKYLNNINKNLNENKTINIEELNYELLYNLIKIINDECEKLKIIKENKLKIQEKLNK